ncbi:MAG: 3-methyl-2-oxobutanoate hydroxymethyltransferase [Candidatus Muproteobacteria bacterium RBG_16_62_13]|uniref:3-methyl-2-oxobutanoate hydroxymethyltransferase n=1 Tax=Candidatus Muproteobacteria bacterium RBG_16_62_13 TaxID=1817756 RepID=A0A1F6T4T9_9PROT|nr:MAG: 3-methyl-2-oxobutanoate hydroxymethyltransferase [Candidatus Muproteobacteria bacterium RBG_16_62_13]
MKQAGEKIACLTAYDYSFASLLDRGGVDLVMVGDSLGMVIQGHDSTLPVKTAHVVYHTQCVARGLSRALLVADMPFMSYQQGAERAIVAAGRLMQDGGAQVVKLEGGEPMADTVRFLTERGIPVCAHLGLTPQSVHQLGGYRVQGRDAPSADRLQRDARLLEQAGAGLIVLEAVPATLAKSITAALSIPTIGIGAGAGTDGQILVLQDMLGLYPRPSPKFSKNFMDGAGSLEQAISQYVSAVKERRFPGPEHSFS